MERRRMIDGLNDNVKLLVVKMYNYIYVGLCLYIVYLTFSKFDTASDFPPIVFVFGDFSNIRSAAKNKKVNV